jgi:hypothetical protein
MISSLPNLIKSINKHITLKNLVKSTFSLRDVIPIINDYNGEDWQKYKRYTFPKSTPFESFRSIPVNIPHQYSGIYNINIIIWYPLVGYSQFQSDKNCESVLKILEGEILDYKFYNEAYPQSASISKKNINEILYTKTIENNPHYTGYCNILCNYTRPTYSLNIVS